jgi:hypothetical protein
MSTLADPTIIELASQGALEITVEEAEDIEITTPGNGNSVALKAPPEDALEEVVVAEAEAAPAIRIPPAIRKRQVRGRYRSGAAAYQLELRVDVDGIRPMKRVSGDFFRVAGGTTTYFGSFVVNAPTVTTTPSKVKIEGAGTFTWAAGAPYVKVTIPRAGISAPAKPATIQFIKPPSTPGASYLCPFASEYFRTVQWEQDSVAGVVPFVSYDTGSLPQPPSSSARVLTVPKAYVEAGIELQVSGAPNVVPVSVAGLNATWSDSELHNAMVNHFSLFANVPQWRVWLLVATAHDQGYRGIMFDYTDAFQRQGCAVFYNAIQGLDPASQRAQLRTYVHELGHAFNLLHSWQKDLADPPQPLGDNGGLGELSWMNYVQNYQPSNGPGGEAAYWSAFPFQFTDNELVHLRHGYYKNVIMGANAFSIGAAEIDPGKFDDPIVDNSGLALELRAKEAYELGEPVVVELKLAATDIRGVETHGYLHPKDDFVTIAIQQPSGRTVIFQPILRRCADESNTVRLGEAQPAIYDNAYIGYGRDGFYFEQPGRYSLRAYYIASDGSRVVSPVLKLRVRPPGTREDVEVAELLGGDQQGKLFTLLGSDAETLADGRDALKTVIEQHGDHRLAVYARLVEGVNAQRDFKDLSAEGVLEIRDAEPEKSIELLKPVEQASIAEEGVDNITLNLAMRTLAKAEAKAGRPEQGVEVLDRMVDVFASKNVNPSVLQTIAEQAEETKTEITS